MLDKRKKTVKMVFQIKETVEQEADRMRKHLMKADIKERKDNWEQFLKVQSGGYVKLAEVVRIV